MVQIKKTLRYKASVISANSFKRGDIVEAIDTTASCYGKIPYQLTIGKKYTVYKSKECVIEIVNDSGRFVNYYANRFKKIEK